jgi:hypothetical protein|tara:strand:- start:1602 stop:2039 length:438 start_codon:yes stop_codon:yes gene_type:complete
MLETKECVVEKAIELFVETVELSPDLEIIGTATPAEEEVFVIRDHSKAKGEDGEEGAYVEVSVKEIVAKVSNVERATQFIDVITQKRKSVVCEGITRIVGYYSRVNNWNKSKVGELRDRTQHNYALGGVTPKYDKERIERINNLS